MNPRHQTVFGHACHSQLGALPEPPDLTVIATPAPTVPGLVAEAAERGSRAALVITAGLDPVQKQRCLDAARPRLLRLLGPNSVGLMLPHDGINASFAHRAALPGDLALLSQSGALVTTVVDWASSRGIGFSHVVSLGDMADVDFGDLLDYLAGDTKSRAILLYIEAVTNAPKFMSAARRAARTKPVIVIKSGRHATAARAAASHTGRLAGADAAYEAAFRRAGVLRVTALDDLFDAAEMLARAPRLVGERLAILTNGGGAGVLAADHLADELGSLAQLNASTMAILAEKLPSAWSKGNPIDVIGDATPERYAVALQTVLADPATDAVLAINCPTALASSTEIAQEVVTTFRNARSFKPLITNWLGDAAAREARALFAQERIPTFETPGAAVRGFMQLVRHARAQDELMRTPPLMEVGSAIDTASAEAMITGGLCEGRSTLTEVESKRLLAAYGIPVAETVTAESAAAAAVVAKRMLEAHGSVALKILSDDITHKSDVGGVRLDLPTPAAVEAAANQMLQHIAGAKPEARIKGFTVSAMIKRPQAHELIVGMSVDKTFGPLIMFGAGGTSVEVVADTSIALPPLDTKLAQDLIARTRIARLLDGYRNRQPADREAIVRTLLAISAMVCRHPQIREIDINPLLADNTGVIALDARVIIADEVTVPRVPLAVKPYPADLGKIVALSSLGDVTVRPIRPDDERLYENFLRHVTPEDIRLRLFAPHKDLSHKFIARMTQIDYAREMAFVAVSKHKGELLGVARFAADPDYERAEYAVLVRSDLKGLGLGWTLMEALIRYAEISGIKELFGSVLRENTGMLKMCREFGFSVVECESDHALWQVSLRFERPNRGA